MKFKLIPIHRCSKTAYKGLVYDLTVKDNHSYSVFNIICHNSICSTRGTTGFGVPTLESIASFSQYVMKDSFLIADGGIRTAGDACKAMAAGASMFTLDRLLAATDLASGTKYNKDLQVTPNRDEYVWAEYRGMASAAVQNKLEQDSSRSIEGVSGLIPYTGTTEEFIEGFLENMRSSVAYYAGCRSWVEFQRYVKFVEMTSNGNAESQTRISHTNLGS